MSGDTVDCFSNNLCSREAAVKKHERKHNQNTQRQSFHLLRSVHFSRENNPLIQEIERHDKESSVTLQAKLKGTARTTSWETRGDPARMDFDPLFQPDQMQLTAS